MAAYPEWFYFFHVLTVVFHSILRPGFFMENYDGFIGAITVSVLKSGLKPDTTVQLVVSLPYDVCQFARTKGFSFQAVDDIGRIAAKVFQVFIPSRTVDAKLLLRP